MHILYQFANIAELRHWLSDKRAAFENANDYNRWLQRLLDGGDRILVAGENIGYEACLQIL